MQRAAKLSVNLLTNRHCSLIAKFLQKLKKIELVSDGFPLPLIDSINKWGASLGTNTFIDGNSFQARLMAPIIMWPSCWFQLSLISYILFILPLTSVSLFSVLLQLQNSTDIAVVLRSVSLQSTGRYRCEVSGEAPSFQTVSGHEDMIVVGKWARDGNTHRERVWEREGERE